jgi:hypothetical protein
MHPQSDNRQLEPMRLGPAKDRVHHQLQHKHFTAWLLAQARWEFYFYYVRKPQGGIGTRAISITGEVPDGENSRLRARVLELEL